MTTIAPGQHTVKPRRITSRGVRHAQNESVTDMSIDVVLNPSIDDPTEYPDSEVMCREPVENEICLQLQPVLRRHLAERGIVAYVGSDNFIYWVKGNPRESVAPDVYVLPGIPQANLPAHYPGTNDEQCWKTWIHHVVPSFALEVKARPNPRKDELKSPARHDALGTKELIVFDPFAHRRRAHRKRFVVFRRDMSGKLIIVLETNDHRVYSQELEVFLVAEGEGDHSLLRLGLEANGIRLVPFESELVDMETRRANEEAQRANQEAQRANQEAQRANEARSIAEEALRRTAKLEAELARLRAEADKRPKRRSKSA